MWIHSVITVYLKFRRDHHCLLKDLNLSSIYHLYVCRHVYFHCSSNQPDVNPLIHSVTSDTRPKFSESCSHSHHQKVLKKNIFSRTKEDMKHYLINRAEFCISYFDFWDYSYTSYSIITLHQTYFKTILHNLRFQNMLNHSTGVSL